MGGYSGIHLELFFFDKTQETQISPALYRIATRTIVYGAAML